jgi:hypothetical protein
VLGQLEYYPVAPSLRPAVYFSISLRRATENIVQEMYLCWGCTSVVKYLPSMHEALGLIPNTTQKKKERESPSITHTEKERESPGTTHKKRKKCIW